MSWREAIFGSDGPTAVVAPVAEPQRAFGQPPDWLSDLQPSPVKAAEEPSWRAAVQVPAVEETWRPASDPMDMGHKRRYDEGPGNFDDFRGQGYMGGQGPPESRHDPGPRSFGFPERRFEERPGNYGNQFQGQGYPGERPYGRPPSPPQRQRRLPLMAADAAARGELARYVMGQEDRMDWAGAGGDSAQDNFSRHLLSAFGFDPEEAQEAASSLNAAHPAFTTETGKADYQLDGPVEWGTKPFDLAYSVWIFDKSYEQAIWDYDPKFHADYLPYTKRGTQKWPPHIKFMMNTNYTADENSWKKYEAVSEKQWRTEFVPKVQYVQKCKEMGVEPPPDLLGKKKATKPEDQPTNVIFAYFVDNIGWKEELVTQEYCAVCDTPFNSVLPSIAHYSHERHEARVRQWFVDSLWDHGKVYEADLDSVWFQNTVNRLMKKYATKPRGWACALCDVELSSGEMARSHFRGTQHQRRAKGLPVVEKVPRDFVKAFENHCAACNVDFRSREEAKRHTETKFHMVNVTACAQNNITLPPGPSSQIGHSQIARKIWKTYAQPTGSAVSGANTQPLGNARPPSDSGAKFRPPGQLGFFAAGQNEVVGNFHCATCNKTFYTEAPYLLHMASQQHSQKEFNVAKSVMRGSAVKALGPSTGPIGPQGHKAKDPGVDANRLQLLREQASRRKKMVALSSRRPANAMPVNFEAAKGSRAVDPAAYATSGAGPYGRPHYAPFGDPPMPPPPPKRQKTVNKKVAGSILEQAKQQSWVSGGLAQSVPDGTAGFVGSWAAPAGQYQQHQQQ